MVPYLSAAGTFIAQDWEVALHVVAGESLERQMEPTECPDGVFGIVQRSGAEQVADRAAFAEVKRLMLEEVKAEREGECCVCLERMLMRQLQALVPCGHRCVCMTSMRFRLAHTACLARGTKDLGGLRSSAVSMQKDRTPWLRKPRSAGRHFVLEYNVLQGEGLG